MVSGPLGSAWDPGALDKSSTGRREGRRGSARVEGGGSIQVSARLCLSFPSLLPITLSLLAFEGKGKAWEAKLPRNSCTTPTSNTGVPTPTVLCLRASSRDSFHLERRGRGVFRTPGSPRGFLRLRQPRPRPGSPAPRRLGSVAPRGACLARRQAPQLSPGCPCSRLASPPLGAPSSSDPHFHRESGTPLHHPLRASGIRGPTCTGASSAQRELRHSSLLETRLETGGRGHTN